MTLYTIPPDRIVWRFYHDDRFPVDKTWTCEAIRTTKWVTYTSAEMLYGYDRDALYRIASSQIGIMDENATHYFGFSLPAEAAPWSWILVHRSRVERIEVPEPYHPVQMGA